MQAAIEQARTQILNAIAFINSQKQTISDLRTNLAQVSSEYSDFQAAEQAEEAEQATLLASLNEALTSLGEASVAE